MAKSIPSPRDIVTYAVASDTAGGRLFLFGDADSPNIAFLCPGFPDDHEVFLPFASLLAESANCLVGVACLPGYDGDHTPNKIGGYTITEMIHSVRDGIKALRKQSTFEGAKLTGVFFDWGVFPGLAFTNRALEEEGSGLAPDRLVIFDVLQGPHPETKDVPIGPKETIYHGVVTLAYRAVFAVAFLIRRYISKVLAQIYFIMTIIPLALLQLTPTKKIDDEVFEARRNKPSLDRMIYMAYPYVFLLKAYLTTSAWTKFSNMSTLPKDLERTPVLYMFGLDKRIMFHCQSARMLLDREEKAGRKSKAVAVEGAGHYLFVQKPEICLAEVTKFIMDA